MRPRRWVHWLVAVFLAPWCLLAMAWLWTTVFGWNWARAPLQDMAMRRTGRALVVGGDLSVTWAWPAPKVSARKVSFANPAWAAEPQMLLAEAVEVRIDLPELLRGRLAFPSLMLTRPRVFLEQSTGGRKSWLLDLAQTDESARVAIGLLGLDRGEAHFVDAARQTLVHAELSTRTDVAPSRSLAFTAQGRWRGLPLVASGSGAGVLAWRDESSPYPLQAKATVGDTSLQVDGTVTGLRTFSAVDLQLDLRGTSLATLFPLIGLALPPTPAYRSSGRLVRRGATWHYDGFDARIGGSDLRGSLAVDTAPARPQLTAQLSSRHLGLADLRPAIGARPSASGQVPAAAGAGTARRLLPELPLDATRWGSLDADVTLRAQVLQHAGAVPLNDLDVHLVLRDRQLTFKPLRFGVAGGAVSGEASFDARQEPMRAKVQVRLRGLRLEKWLPAADSRTTSIGRVDGELDLSGHGSSVGRMLATSDGRISLVAQNGRISRLLMEKSGLHLLEILKLSFVGDQSVALNCAVADFSVQTGTMQSRALVLDTEVNTLVGEGRIDLGKETLDLRVVPRTRVSSIVALRGPVYIRGSLLDPKVTLDTGSIAARGASTLLLGLLNPLLALIPLFEAGPGAVSECGRLVREAQSRPLAPEPLPAAR